MQAQRRGSYPVCCVIHSYCNGIMRLAGCMVSYRSFLWKVSMESDIGRRRKDAIVVLILTSPNKNELPREKTIKRACSSGISAASVQDYESMQDGINKEKG